MSPPTNPTPPAQTLAANPVLVAAPTDVAVHRELRHTPLYKKWWLWTVVGVVAAGAAIGIGVAIADSNGGPTRFPTVYVP